MTIDPRLIERRHEVAEHNAQKNVGRLLKFLAVVVAVAGIVWFVLSPWMSVAVVITSGIDQSGAHETLARHDIVAGTPMVLLDIDAVREDLAKDPWIVSAAIDLDWPDQVSLVVEERVPLVWTQTREGWTRRALDGVALPSGPEPPGDSGRIVMPRLSSPETSVEMLGALTFYDTLPNRLHQGTTVYLEGGELWATVSGYQVRLGRGVEMAEKALSLTALLEKNLPESSVVVLIAPTNPAVTSPVSPAEEIEQDGSESAVTDP